MAPKPPPPKSPSNPSSKPEDQIPPDITSQETLPGTLKWIRTYDSFPDDFSPDSGKDSQPSKKNIRKK